MTPSRVKRTCWGVAAITAVLGGLLWVLPPRVHVTPAPPLSLDSSGSVAAVTARPDIAEDIAVANVFAATRTPPNTRFVPPEFAGESANGMMPEPSASSDPAAPPLAADVPQLFGTVIGPDGTKALLHLDPASPAPRLYGPGERDGGYRVLSISPRAVVLRGPGGRVTLRLDPEEDRP